MPGSRKPTEERRSWIVRTRETVYKEHIIDDVTEEQAWRMDGKSVDERETDRVDWEVVSVEPNE